MPSLTKGKHEVGDVDGVRCTIVETGISKERVNYLKSLLEHNKFEVHFMADNAEGEPETFTVGVADLLFNPVIAIYERSLRTHDNQIVSPDIWLEKATTYNARYWMQKKA